jgi:hypothetical protein
MRPISFRATLDRTEARPIRDGARSPVAMYPRIGAKSPNNIACNFDSSQKGQGSFRSLQTSPLIILFRHEMETIRREEQDHCDGATIYRDDSRRHRDDLLSLRDWTSSHRDNPTNPRAMREYIATIGSIKRPRAGSGQPEASSLRRCIEETSGRKENSSRSKLSLRRCIETLRRFRYKKPPAGRRRSQESCFASTAPACRRGPHP